jgi:hypothetical protein
LISKAHRNLFGLSVWKINFHGILENTYKDQKVFVESSVLKIAKSLSASLFDIKEEVLLWLRLMATR